MNEENQTSHSPFEEAIMSLAHPAGIERDKSIWNAALNWASQNAYMEVVDEFKGRFSERFSQSFSIR